MSLFDLTQPYEVDSIDELLASNGLHSNHVNTYCRYIRYTAEQLFSFTAADSTNHPITFQEWQEKEYANVC